MVGVMHDRLWQSYHEGYEQGRRDERRGSKESADTRWPFSDAISISPEQDIAALQAENERLKQEVLAQAELIGGAIEVAEAIEAFPWGSLHNYGGRSSKLDEARWAAKREAAQDILTYLVIEAPGTQPEADRNPPAPPK